MTMTEGYTQKNSNCRKVASIVGNRRCKEGGNLTIERWFSRLYDSEESRADTKWSTLGLWGITRSLSSPDFDTMILKAIFELVVTTCSALGVLGQALPGFSIWMVADSQTYSSLEQQVQIGLGINTRIVDNFSLSHPVRQCPSSLRNCHGGWGDSGKAQRNAWLGIRTRLLDVLL